MESTDFAEGEDDALENSFKLATDYITENASNIQQDDLLYLYGRYKQSLSGTCKEPMPGILKFKSRSKWSAWNSLGDMTKEEAMKQYIEKVSRISPDWDVSKQKSSKSHFGPVNSTLQKIDPELKEEFKTVFDFVKEGNVNQLQILLVSNPSLRDCFDENGLSLLHWACDRGHFDVAKCLISAGININCQDKDGQTPIHYASSCGHEAVISLLLRNGASTSIYDSDGLTPADVAYSTAVKELLLTNAV